MQSAKSLSPSCLFAVTNHQLDDKNRHVKAVSTSASALTAQRNIAASKMMMIL